MTHRLLSNILNLLKSSSLWLCLTVMLFLISCGPQENVTRYYEQNLSLMYWSADQQFIYAVYSNLKRDDGTRGYFIYKIDLEGNYTLLFEGEGEFPSVLGFDAENEIFYCSFRYTPNQPNQGNPSGKPAIYQLKDQQLTEFIPGHGAPDYGYLDQKKLYLTTYQWDLLQEDQQGRLRGGWGRYVLSDKHFKAFQSKSELVLQAGYTEPFYSKIFISSLSPGIHASYLKQAVYAWGDLDLEAAEISNVKELPEYTQGILSFWEWLSEDEILFSVIDEGRRYLGAVSFNLSTETYTERSEFKRRGLLSPDRKWLTYVSNNKLIVSKPDGSQAKHILDVRNFPKGRLITLL